MDEFGDMKKFYIFVSPEIARAYRHKQLEAKEFVYFKEGDLQSSVLFSNCEVKGVEAMRGRKEWFATPAENIVYATKMEDGPNAIRIEQNHRDVDLFFDYWFAVDVWDMQQVFVTNAWDTNE